MSNRKPTQITRLNRLPQLRARRGATVVENALLLTIVCGAFLMGGQFLSTAISHSFQQSMTESLEGPQMGGAKAMSDTGRSIQAASHAAEAPRNWFVIAQIAAASLIMTFLIADRVLRVRRGEQQDETVATNDHLTSDQQRKVFSKRQQILQILSGNMKALLSSRIEVGHLMSEDLTTIPTSMPAEQVIQTMRAHQIRHLLVVDKSGQLVGIISDRDLRRPDAKTAAQMMTPDPFTVSSDTAISPAITMMVKGRFSSLPIVDGDRLVGLLTKTDLAMALQCSLQVLQQVAEEIKSDSLSKPEEPSAEEELVSAF